MPRSLSGRIIASFAALSLALLVAIGGTVFVVLRDLHRASTESRMADLADSLLPQLRASIAAGNLQGALADTQRQLAATGVDITLATADGQLHPINNFPSVTGTIDLTTASLRGQDVHSTSAFADDKQHSWAATKVNARFVVFSTLDRSGAEALGDLARTIPIGLVAVLVIGGPLAFILSRSVTGPLRRLQHATASVPTTGSPAAGDGDPGAATGRAPGPGPGPVPLEGPREVRELTEHFNAMTAELRATRDREEHLLANLRHDLRTPLTVIGGFATAIADGTASGSEATKAARTIGQEATRLERLVAELDTMERLRTGTGGLQPEQIDAGALLDQTVERFRARAAGKGVELAVIGATAQLLAAPAGSAVSGARIAVPDLGFSADRVAVDRILGNLIENALVVVPSPGGHVWLEVRGSTDWITLLVSDDGPGFPPGGTERIFDRFFRGDPARSGTSSGLGLAIVRELARAHGGEALAESLAPRGARVIVHLPRVPRVA
ncbi:MAG TPA: HAMP domain-containing sensor histidine kinase [Candidatus Limnocylindrales bacterium]